ncbi:MAG: chitobiase/beta-hexosaminidase C-terminal domain-containing protein, partial [Candidatus Hydrogenedentes bacterium]|nr:chitobiase/beta-hexosaminidase C-terminal domain-containing protein [Candidatus Hydrogenedentota bacterium]
FLVTDFGAGPGLDDNTEAFARALEAGRAKGGGTVYVPAGLYRFGGQFVVPSGVELRGCFDVPHHTVSAGSVLMPTAGRGDADGTPFIRLEPASGLRGVTLWYPEQNLCDIAPYPWAVQALGPRCWLIDVTLGNAYQGVDLWTHPSDGHVVRYLAGAVLRKGLFVSKSSGPGWVEDVQFNPHYGLRLPAALPRPQYDHEPFKEIIDQQRGRLDGLVFGRCEQEHLTRNFLYAAYDGIAFRDDEGGANARIIMHGTDTGSRAAVIESAGGEGLEFINAQLVPLGDYEVGGIVVEDAFEGHAAFFNTQMWAGNTSAIIAGRGQLLLQQMNTISGPIIVKSGHTYLECLHFARDLNPHLRIESGCIGGRLFGNLYANGAFAFAADVPANRCAALANSAWHRLPAPAGQVELTTGWEESEPAGLASTIAEHGGGLRNCRDVSCAPVEIPDAHSGRRALRVAGHADDPNGSYVYFNVFDQPLQIHPDTELSYWFRPMNERARNVSVDVLFADGKPMRDSGVHTTENLGTHPGVPKGTVGEWRRIAVRLGPGQAGRAVVMIMFAYDSRGGGGPFEAFIDDFAFEPRGGAGAYQVAATPRGGPAPRGTRVTLSAPEGVGIRYTLDGTDPTAQSSRYDGPVALDTPGLCEVRYAAESAEGRVSGIVFGELYDVQ